ncbi:MAG: hypothetical protein K8F92_06400 [Hyphomicrobium sp.]|uniref:hypothetical protein n=1 Tax=Hyphomicrobium sp. TaxID=82 RepID=UPI001324505A|nr:hypothetical protein [Hyphomicrobium sp.]KAB2942293.1 MAG: hypothetical protein F9K20_07085 [Hyphomicrobium sp.]MBZ0209265.1 hypothetical protein [Hyphomicrobium sp.]
MLYTVGEAAFQLGLSADEFRDLVADGIFPEPRTTETYSLNALVKCFNILRDGRASARSEQVLISLHSAASLLDVSLVELFAIVGRGELKLREGARVARRDIENLKPSRTADNHHRKGEDYEHHH